MRREKRLTKRQRKEKFGKGPSGTPAARHIHCLACGRHIDPSELDAPAPTATMLTCLHGSSFASCTACVTESQARIAEHDRTGQAPRAAAAWH